MALLFHRRKTGALPIPGPDSVVVIEEMRRRHVREVVPIEEQIFPRPWSAALYLSELAQGASRLYYVALVDGVVVGYTGCMLLVGECHITTVGVAPSWQRKGVGMRLLHRLANDARRMGATSLALEVRVTNTGAQELYRAFGFAPSGIRKNYYAEVNEDGLVMWASDIDSPAYQMRLDAIAMRIANKGTPGPGATGEEHP